MLDRLGLTIQHIPLPKKYEVIIPADAISTEPFETSSAASVALLTNTNFTSNPNFFPYANIMGDYCTPLRGIMEITPTEGQIMCPEGCIMPQRDAVDRRSRHPEGA